MSEIAPPLARIEGANETANARTTEHASIRPSNPQYGQQAENSQTYYTQQVNGLPHVPSVTQPLIPIKSGFVTSIPLPYDIYGNGPIKIFFLCGLGLSRHSWKYQVEYFVNNPDYTCLVIENRGYDDYEANIPLKIPGTKQMARDMMLALQELEWDLPKGIHVVGLGLGGMIALQMGRVCPEVIASLHLVSTAQKFRRPAFSAANTANSLQLLKRRSQISKPERLLELLLPADYLYAQDTTYAKFANNRARLLHEHHVQKVFSDQQKTLNFYFQLLAYTRHSLTQADLWEIAAKVRFIFVSGADNDFVTDSDCSRDLMAGLHAQGRIYQGGHMIPWQNKDEFNADQEAMMLRADREYAEYPPLECLCLSDQRTGDECEPEVVPV